MRIIFLIPPLIQATALGLSTTQFMLLTQISRSSHPPATLPLFLATAQPITMSTPGPTSMPPNSASGITQTVHIPSYWVNMQLYRLIRPTHPHQLTGVALSQGCNIQSGLAPWVKRFIPWAPRGTVILSSAQVMRQGFRI